MKDDYLRAKCLSLRSASGDGYLGVNSGSVKYRLGGVVLYSMWGLQDSLD